MSIRNIQNPQIKGWLNAKFHDVNARVIDLESTDELVTFAGSIINLNSSAGSIGQVLKKDASNIVSWETDTQVFGSYEKSQVDHEVTPFTTTSVTPVTVSTFTTDSLTAGEYLIHYSMEVKNVASNIIVLMGHDTTATGIQDWSLNGGIDEYHNCVGFKQINMSGVNAFSFATNVVTPATTNSCIRARFQIYRLS